MAIRDVNNSNQFLRDLTPGNPWSVRFKVDNFRHTYFAFSEKFTLPSVNLSMITDTEIESILMVLGLTVPDYVHGLQALPEPRPMRESDKLHLVKRITLDGHDYLYMLRFTCDYLGGAKPEDILNPAAQGFSPTLRTERFYYTARLFPIKSHKSQGDQLIDFEPLRLRDAISDYHVGEIGRTFSASVVFDDVDFSKTEDFFQELFQVDSEWGMKSLFRPFVVEFGTICLNLLSPDPDFVLRLGPYFHRALVEFLNTGNLENLSQEDRRFWRAYYQAWAFKRFLSVGGNPHWDFEAFPDLGWLDANGF